MHLHDINNLINFQDVKIVKISEPIQNKVYITLEPLESHQPCPSCNSMHTIRRGSKTKIIRHLDLWEYQTLLVVPSIRLSCKSYHINFSWVYSFITGKSRYTNAFKDKLAKTIDGSTVKHATRILNIPYTTGERFIKNNLSITVPCIQDQVAKQASQSERLVIGIDDFAIRKGHSYNTGIHDLRNNALLYIAKGRKYEQLTQDNQLMTLVSKLQPVAVVMDLAKSYHNFAKKVFPYAIRIADRFHINRYITDALHDLRKRISKVLPTKQAKTIKENKNILGKRFDSLKPYEKDILYKMLDISDNLAKVYWLKEDLITWYDYSHKFNALHLLDKWIHKGHSLDIPEVNKALKTFENWRIEISNYHYCRFTNASVEGRNNKIKALQRRSYFLRNRQSHEYRIYLECNCEALVV
ncbi:MAG: ISL3 family transposase [Marinisporobacter sp.]|jgi:transposase|nr:ISL3 family transposase [Marinisporobacter sp.]